MPCYPHMPIYKVLINRLLFVCVFVCIRLRISPLRIKLAVSLLHGGSSASNGPRQESHIFVNFALPEKPKIGRIGKRAGHAHQGVNIIVDTLRRKRHATDTPFVKSPTKKTFCCVVRVTIILVAKSSRSTLHMKSFA